MDHFDDIQIEEFSNYDFIEELIQFFEELNESIDAEEKFNVNDYINGNIDY